MRSINGSYQRDFISELWKNDLQPLINAPLNDLDCFYSPLSLCWMITAQTGDVQVFEELPDDETIIDVQDNAEARAEIVGRMARRLNERLAASGG